MKKIICFLFGHRQAHKAWKEHIATGVNKYHSLTYCERCNHTITHLYDYM